MISKARTPHLLQATIIPTKKGEGLITYVDCLPENLDMDWDNVGYTVDYDAQDNWRQVAEILQTANQLIKDLHRYPFSEPFFHIDGGVDEEGNFLGSWEVEPSKPSRNNSRTICALYLIQELACAHEIIKNLQKSLLKDTLENLIYSIGIDMRLDLSPSVESLEHMEVYENSTSTACETQPMADGYKRMFTFLQKDERLTSLNELYKNIHEYGNEAYCLLNVMTSETSARLKNLSAIIEEKHKNKKLIIHLLNDRVAHVLSTKEKTIRKEISNGIRCGVFTIEDKLKECYKRLNKCSLYKSFVDYPENLKGFADFIADQFSKSETVSNPFIDFQVNKKDLDTIYKEQNSYWEFLSCVVELELLNSIKNGTPLPIPFFPVEREINTASTEEQAKRQASKLDRFILGDGEEKQANKEKFCQNMKAIHDNDAKARYVSSQIGKTISNWPSHSTLKQEGLVTCAASTWSGHVSLYKSKTE